MAQSTPSKQLAAVSVPAKVILFGEHAVVYPGNHAILWPLKSLTADVAVQSIDEKNIYRIQRESESLDIAFPELSTAFSEFKDLKTYVKACVWVAHQHVSKTKQPRSLKVIINLNIPAGGFGSSAAVAASLIKAIAEANGLVLDQSTWYELVMAAEKLPHGNPSGADAAAATLQKPIIVKKQPDGSVETKELKPGSSLRKLIESTHVIYTGRSEHTTADTVARVADHEDSANIMRSIEQNTRKVIDLIEQDTFSADSWCETLNTNGRLLEKVGVVPQKYVEMSESIRAVKGAIKMSGGGAMSGESCGAMIGFKLPADIISNYKSYKLS